MGHKTVLAAGSAAAAIAALMLTSASAQNAGPAAPAKAPAAAGAEDAAAAKKKSAAAAALKSYDAGARAYESGKLDTAIQSLSAALSSGGLQSQQMAKALYYRGAAYRKQGKPAQAISDLTTAVWLKNGLSDTDRALAIDQRQAAYREAGLGDSAPPVVTQRAEAPAAPSPAAAPAPAPAASAYGSPAVNISNPGQSSGGLFSWFNFGGSPQPAPAPAPVAAAPAATPPQAAVSSWSTTETSPAPAPSVPAPVAMAPAAPAPSVGFAPQATDAPAAPAPVAPVQTALNAVPSEAPATPQPAASSSNGPSTLAEAGKAVTGFFGNLFSSNSAGAQATQTSSSPVLTSSTGPATAPANAAVEWGQATSVVTPGSAVKPATGAPAPVTAAPHGKYKLQVAAVRSRDEASQWATRLMQQQGGRLGARQPEIDEAVIGNMGTFYRVRVGPFASADEPGQLCSALRPQGYDCLVVSQ